MAKVKYTTIPPTAIVNMNIVGSFYIDVRQLLIGLVSEISPEEYQACLTKLTNKEPATTIKEANITLLTAFIMHMEETAKKQGVTEDVLIDIPDEPTNP